jgi:hypothetical protein
MCDDFLIINYRSRSHSNKIANLYANRPGGDRSLIGILGTIGMYISAWLADTRSPHGTGIVHVGVIIAHRAIGILGKASRAAENVSSEKQQQQCNTHVPPPSQIKWWYRTRRVYQEQREKTKIPLSSLCSLLRFSFLHPDPLRYSSSWGRRCAHHGLADLGERTSPSPVRRPRPRPRRPGREAALASSPTWARVPPIVGVGAGSLT